MLVSGQPGDGFSGLAGVWQGGQQQQGAGGNGGGYRACNNPDYPGSALPDLAHFMTQLLRGGSPVCANKLGTLGAAQGGSWVLLQSSWVS